MDFMDLYIWKIAEMMLQGKRFCPNRTSLHLFYIYNFIFTQENLVNKSAGGYRWR